MKINPFFRFIMGAFFAVASGAMFVCLVAVLLRPENISLKFTDSFIDKIMFVLMLIGCAGGYAVGSIAVFSSSSFVKSIKIQIPGLISMVCFLVGIYYHMMFGSPL